MNIHADSIDKYCKDWKESTTPWEMWLFQKPDNTEWFDCFGHPAWNPDYKYRRKPKIININGFEVHEPVKSPLKHGQTYFVPMLTGYSYYIGVWNNCQSDKNLLHLGLIHLDQESAVIHAKALLSFTQIKEE